MLNLKGRNRNFAINTTINLFTRFGVIGINFLLVPLLLLSVGKERYGIWQTLLAAISWGSLLNFGLGNGLRNLITELLTKERNEEIGLAIASVLKLLLKIVFVGIIIFVPIILFLFNPNILFSHNQIPSNEIIYAFTIFSIFFLLNISIEISNSIAYGFQKSAIPGLMHFFYLLFTYLLLLLLKSHIKTNLITLSFLFGGLQSIIYIASFYWQVHKFKIKLNFEKRYSLKKIYKLSGYFFLAQLLSIVYITIDNFTISFYLGAQQTAEFSVLSRIFYAIIGIYSVLLIQFWNSVAEANIKNENSWIIKTSIKLAYIAFLVFIGCLGISYLNNPLLKTWLGSQYMEIAHISFYSFSVYTLLHCLNAIIINIQNGLGQLKFQIISISVGLSIYFIGCLTLPVADLGYNYLIILKIISMTIVLAINSIFLIKFLRKNNVSQNNL